MPKKASASKGKSSDPAGDEGKLKGAQSVKLRHILCEKQSKHLEALAELEKGVSFDKVASAMSEDKARQGGSLGFMTRQGMVGPFQEVVFDIPISTVAKPIYRTIKTKFGFHIVMVEARQ